MYINFCNLFQVNTDMMAQTIMNQTGMMAYQMAVTVSV